MRGKFELLMVIAVLYPLGISAQGIEGIVRGLESVECWQARADYSITLPQATDDVVYTVAMESKAAPGDTLAPGRLSHRMGCRHSVGTLRRLFGLF